MQTRIVALAAFAGLAAALAAIVLHSGSDRPIAAAQATEAGTLPTVRTITVHPRAMAMSVSGIGHVIASDTAEVKSRVDGPIEKVLFVEGEEVAAGKPLFEIDPRPYRAAVMQAEGQLARDQAQYLNAKADYDRAVSLNDRGFASLQTLQQRRAAMDGASASVKTDQAMVDTARLNLEFSTIRAPIAGRLGRRHVDIGNLVRSSDGISLVQMVQMHPIAALFTVTQSYLEEIRSGMRAGALPVEAISADSRKLLGRGQLALIDNQIDPQTGTVELKATFANEDEALWPGQLIEARLIFRSRRDSLAVPEAALAQSPDGRIVFVVEAAHRIAIRRVTVGSKSDGDVVIESGLQPGDQVVVEKLDLLAPGMEVNVVPS